MKRILMLAAVFAFTAGTLMCGSDNPRAGYDGDDAGGGGGGGGGTLPGASSSGGGGGGGGCAACEGSGAGAGTGNPFDIGTHESAGVQVDPSGGLVLDPSSTAIPNIIWIANTRAGTVTKVDTRTYKVLGRYAIGDTTRGLDPSRTSVNAQGDVFVGNRAGGRLLKISSAGAKCPDTNKDGVVTTSTGIDDVLAWGHDDCVLWEVAVPGESMVRGVAAQDREIPDPKIDNPMNVREEHFVWTGGTTAPYTIHKYDGITGQQLIASKSPTSIYGLALDGNGQLWISGNLDQGGASFGRVDTNRCSDQASCDAAEICTSTCTTSGACTCTKCSGACDQAIKERIEVPSSVYGITVDYKQRVWLTGGGIHRYDPKAPANQRYTLSSGTGSLSGGIAADAKGFVWAGSGGSAVLRTDGDSLQHVSIRLPSKGMAVDRDGKIWSISYDNGAGVIVPGATINDNPVTSPAGNNPELAGDANGDSEHDLGYCYTYSDMTGQQLALATNRPGYYRQVFDPCTNGKTSWFDLDWSVSTPASSRVQFAARSAATKAGLASAPWVIVATAPPSTPRILLAKAFGSTPLLDYLEIEVRLYGAVAATSIVSPVVSKFDVTKSCNVKPN